MGNGYTATDCQEAGAPQSYYGHLTFNPLEADEEKVVLCFPFALSMWVSAAHRIDRSDIAYLVSEDVEAIEGDGYLPLNGAVQVPAGKSVSIRARKAGKRAVFTITLKQTDVPAIS